MHLYIYIPFTDMVQVLPRNRVNPMFLSTNMMNSFSKSIITHEGPQEHDIPGIKFNVKVLHFLFFYFLVVNC